ncbi:class F sortase [Paenibacillus sp. sgz302251]|uniref:class F sortase n=1 Tax=Paenibacillus sp. sgz302251 TaxID=3414493 RepID=UPI003C7A2C12
MDMKKWIVVGLTIMMISCSTACSKFNRANNNSGSSISEEKSVRTDLNHPDSGKKKIAEVTKIKETKKEIKDIQITKKLKSQSKSKVGIIPDSLYIPAVRINAKIEPVTIKNGQMGVPRNTARVGYLASTGILPGAPGNAIIDGHVDNYKGPAVFYRLKKLKKGDIVVIKSKKGEKIKFIVESVEKFKTDEAPIQKIFGASNEPRLNLITCGGKYNRSKKEYDARLVVFTKRAQ